MNFVTFEWVVKVIGWMIDIPIHRSLLKVKHEAPHRGVKEGVDFLFTENSLRVGLCGEVVLLPAIVHLRVLGVVSTARAVS